MDSQSLDGCIQKTLSSLFPPFELTAATVLCQVLDVVEKTYRGDGLAYLIDFLIPAKRVLQGLQQEACVQYCGLLFRDAAWPLCIQEKIVLQLASINWRLLRPGDFYFQVVPYLRKTPRIVLKCLAQDQHNVEELVLPEGSYTSIFTLEWLDFINSGRMGTSLENCLLTCDDRVFRVPWEAVVQPEFIEETKGAEATKTLDSSPPSIGEPPKPHASGVMVQDEETPCTSDGQATAINIERRPSEMEGEYVELSEVSVPRFGPQLGSLTQSIAANFKNQQKRNNPRDEESLLQSGTRHEGCFSSAQVATEPLQPSTRGTFTETNAIRLDTEVSLRAVQSHLRDGLGCRAADGSTKQEPVFIERMETDVASGYSLSVERTMCGRNAGRCDISVDTLNSHPGSADTNTASCERPTSETVNFSASLSPRLEVTSRFTESIGDAKDMEEASTGPVGEHPGTRGCPITDPANPGSSKSCVHRANGDQTVPSLQSPSLSESTEGKTGDVNAANQPTDDAEAQELRGSNPAINITDQSAPGVPEADRAPYPPDEAPCRVSAEHADAVRSSQVDGDSPAALVTAGGSVERAEQGDTACNTSEHSKRETLESAKDQPPLETLYEVTEEELPLSGANHEPADEREARDVSVTERAAEQERPPERQVCVASRRLSVVSSPVLTRRGHRQPVLTLADDVNVEILMSGLVYLPGTRDRSGRAVVIINTRNTAWLNPHCNASELGRLLLYLYGIPRRDCRSLGLTLLVDARRCSPVPALFKAFHRVQAAVPNCIHGILFLVEKDVSLSVDKPHGVPLDLLTSTKSLHKHIEASQLPLEFDGSFPYCHRDWLAFRMKLEHMQEACRDACTFLQNAIKNLHAGALPDRAEEANRLLKKFGQLMRTVLEDTRLVKLQTEGGAILARLRKEESCVAVTEDYRDAVDAAAELYNRVDERVHSLAQLSNKRIQDMELVMEFEAFEETFQEISGWIENVGERLLSECGVTEDSLEVALQAQRRFRELDGVACEYCRRGQEILKSMERWESLSSPDFQKHRWRLQTYRERVWGFCARLEESRSRLEKTVRLYQFFDKAYEWALEGMRRLASISLDDCNSPDLCGGALEGLERYQAQHPEIGEKKFEEMRELACELKSEKGAKQWRFAWSKCQEARHVFEKKLEAALRTKRALSAERRSAGSGAQRRHSDSTEEKESNVSYFHSQLLSPPPYSRERKPGQVLGNRSELVGDQAPYKSSHLPSAASVLAPAFRVRKMSLQSIPGEDLPFEFLPRQAASSSTPSAPARPPTRHMLRKAQSFDLPCSEGGTYGCQRRLSEPARHGNTGVFIKGLEVSSTELVDRPCAPRQPLPVDWSSERLHGERRSSVSSAEGRSRSSKLRHIIDEMVTTEREYVRSLWYISENYFPEMERLDLPQDLRGKRGIIFGNLEKLRDFHSQYFLKELESCCNHPLRVSHCFLRHKDQFGMYALYSKNKPRSDALLASHGNVFFKNKQHQLGDKMDLASYLLKPIQRMSKYALLLKDLIKECEEAQEQELVYLRAAEEMVKFQLRHGNDLLAMDAIRDCDVNLKEQGQLVRQDEFTVWLGRKKCQRHVFLFEDLILFSKPKRIEGGLDVFIYKRSFKTADIGLTENSGDSGLRFEIWFRRRKSSDTYILQSNGPETKQAWTGDIAKILWQQATRNKEIRMQEMVSMGVGNKPFLDIKPSDAAINNRAIDYIMKGRGARTRASIAVSLFDHSDPYKRSQASSAGSSTPAACGPSSASLLGPLNLHMYINQTLLPGVLPSKRSFETSMCLEEDELENETSSSQPSMTTESSGSSQCVSGAGSSGSDSGCVSGIPQDSLSEDAASPCDPSSPYSLQETKNRSSLRSPNAEKSRFPNRQYISANTSHISLSPSTIV
ncbi:puratrophin-1-like [Spea bombifrons]|uniref:puratrophin-1-like n=1 Tax=Spea bombifrons TaxID=233779 RepID=UPI0023491675|nr:puratrophin-1-like [Spea bombifrons]